MKLFWALAILLALSVGILTFVEKEKEKVPADIAKQNEEQNYVESVAISSSSASSVQAAQGAEFKLRILSEPESAELFLDGQKVGVTPYELSIAQQSQKLKLSAEGFDDYERQVPAAKDAEGDLVWKIQLKKTTSKSVANSEASRNGFHFEKKRLKGWLLQLKALSLKDFGPTTPQEFVNLSDVKFCKVKIKGEEWVRILVGPYVQKNEAQKVLGSIHIDWPQAFLTRDQECLGQAGNMKAQRKKK